MLFARGRYKEAAGAFEAAVARAPSRLDASYNAAKALIHAKRWSLAVPHLQRARELAPTNEDVWFELRTLFLRLDRGRGGGGGLRALRADRRAVGAARRRGTRHADARRRCGAGSRRARTRARLAVRRGRRGARRGAARAPAVRRCGAGAPVFDLPHLRPAAAGAGFATRHRSPGRVATTTPCCASVTCPPIFVTT